MTKLNPEQQAKVESLVASLMKTGPYREAMFEALKSHGVTAIEGAAAAPATPAGSAQHLVRAMMGTDQGRDELFEALRAEGVSPLRALASLKIEASPERQANARRAIILDSETTGLDHTKDKVIQLSMLEAFFDEDGLVGFGEFFDRYRDPGQPIDAEITALTGITNEMVKGQVITSQEIRDFVRSPELIAAHNAAFDRKMVEAKQNFPDAGFERLAWACSVAQVDWSARGFSSPKLEFLALHQGFTYPAHNSRADCEALAHVLCHKDANGVTGFAEMISKGQAGQILIVAANSPFSAKDELKAAGYRWTGDDTTPTGGHKAWYTVVDNDPVKLAEQARVLEKAYGRECAVPMRHLDARTMYSARIKDAHEGRFRTAEAKTPVQALAQEIADPMLF